MRGMREGCRRVRQPGLGRLRLLQIGGRNARLQLNADQRQTKRRTRPLAGHTVRGFANCVCSGNLPRQSIALRATRVAALLRGSATGCRAWYTEGHLMTLFTGTLIVIAVASTVGAAYAWWPRSH